MVGAVLAELAQGLEVQATDLPARVMFVEDVLRKEKHNFSSPE